MEISKQTITVIEAAKILGIGRSSAYEAIKKGELPSLRLGGRIVVPVVALTRLLETSDGTPRD